MSALAEKISDAEALLVVHSAASDRSAWAAKAQDGAKARFQSYGVPGRRDEYWKFTDPTSLTVSPAPNAALFDGQETPIFSTIDHVSLVFVDGEFRPDLSDEQALEHAEVQLLDTAMSSDIHWAADVYGRLEARGQDPVQRPLAALNTAVAKQGVAIRVTGACPRPIGLRYLHQSETSDAILHHVIRIENGASLTVLESGPAAARVNKVMEVDVADRATFNHVSSQGRDHERRAVTHIFARLGTESSFKSFTMTVNGVLTRNESVIELTGDDAAAHVAGAAVGDGVFHHDDTVFVTHDAVNCESRQVFKKVLRNGAVGVFQGKILVQPDAQKTDGYQISQGLLLDDDSQFLAKPELEIYADDVACSHGSTVGSVDDTALFYLTSRGVPRKQAQDLLVLAFLAEAMEEIADQDIAEILTDRLSEWMARRA